MKELTQIIVTSPDLFNITDAAKELKITRMTLYRWMTSDKIAVIRLGGVWYIPRSEIDKKLRDGYGKVVEVAKVAPNGVDDADKSNSR